MYDQICRPSPLMLTSPSMRIVALDAKVFPFFGRYLDQPKEYRIYFCTKFRQLQNNGVERYWEDTICKKKTIFRPEDIMISYLYTIPWRSWDSTGIIWNQLQTISHCVNKTYSPLKYGKWKLYIHWTLYPMTLTLKFDKFLETLSLITF